MTDPATESSNAAPTADARLDRAVEPEYAAVSGWAIVALILAGIAVVAFAPTPAYLPLPGTWIRFPLLLALPLAAIGVALGAARDIRRSEGTKVGLTLARAALVLALVTALGAGVFHGLRQYQEYTLHRTLVERGDEVLQWVIDNEKQAVFQTMLANDPGWAEHRGAFDRQWDFLQRYLRDPALGGQYYGRFVQQTTILPPTEPDDPPFDRGRVVHRFRMGNGAMDVLIHFLHVDGQWKLVRVLPSTGALVFPKDNETPKPRFEP